MKLSELLKILLKSLNEGGFKKGLCHLNSDINAYKSWENYSYVDKYLCSNRPLTWYSFWNITPYWWKPGLVEPRRKWLEKHIKKLEKKGL